MTTLIIIFILYTISKDILGAINTRRFYYEQKEINLKIKEDNESWKNEVRQLLSKK